ncbi:MAG: MBG domain-containing protein, partial [Chitinophagaceae bacterium]
MRGVFITKNGGSRLTLGANPYSVTTMVKRSGGSLTGLIQGNNWYEVEYSGTSKTTGEEWSGVGMRNLKVSLNATDTLYLNSNKTIQNYLYLNSGFLHTQSYTLTHLDQTEGSIFGAGPGSYIIGRFRRLISPGIGEYTFPVGGSSFSPVKISFTQSDGGSIVVRSANGDHPGINSSSLNTLRTVNRYWYTIADSGLLNYSCALTLNWAILDQDAYFNRSSAVAAVFNRSTSSWSYPSLNQAVSGSTSLQVTGITALQDFQIGQVCKYTSISSQPVGGSVCENSGSFTLSVTAGGDEPFTYQWQKDGANLINAYASSYTTSQAGSYRVIVTGQCGTQLSDTARVTPKLITAIVAQPASAVICSGTTMELSVSAVGENLTYQWNKDGLPITGASSPRYVASLAGNYTVVITGACGTVTSVTSVVSFYKPTVILSQPVKSTITYGNTASFSLQASGEGTLAYQWQVNAGAGWTNITGNNVYSNPTTPALTLTKPSVTYSGYLYRCIVTASCGTVTSSEVSLTVTKVLITVTAQNKTRIYGDRNPLFTVTYAGFVTGETFETSGITGQPALATTAVASSAPGSYPITAAVGTLLSANYSFSFVNAVLTISKAPLVVKADNQTRLYGSANPVLTWIFVGLMNNETAATSGITGSPNISTTANTSSAVGNYTISIATGNLASVNYSFSTFQAGTLTVAKAPLNVTAKDATRVYGGSNPAFSVTYSGLVNNDQLSKTVSGTPSITTPAIASSPVGLYDIIPGQGTLTVSNNYYLNYVYGKLSVTKASLSVVAQNTIRPYGAANPTFSVGFSGFLNGDTYATSNITGLATFTTTATLSSPVGNYSVTPAAGTLSSPNYNFTSFVNGTLTVFRADLKVVADNKSRAYGKSNPVLTYHYEGFINGDSTTNNAVTGTPDLLLSATATSDAGEYPIVVDMGTLASANYSFTLVSGTLAVDKAPLTITASDTSRLYGVINPVFTYRVTGFVNGQTLATSGVSGTPDITTPALPNSSAGIPYPIQVQQGTLSAKNYSFQLKNGVLTVLKATLTVTADAKTKKYGSENPVFTASYSGFVNGETLLNSGLSGQPALSTAATATSLPGLYDITVAQGTLLSTNYTFQFRKGTMEIIKKILQVKALPQSKKYGDPLPAFTYTITGWDSGTVNQNNTVTGQPEMLTTATPSSKVGIYEIEPRLGTLSSTYYLFEFVKSSLTITSVPLQIQVQDTAR